MAVWRRITEDEEIVYDYRASRPHGYITEVAIMLNGHHNCNCHRSYTASIVRFYSEHHPRHEIFPFFYSDAWHDYMSQSLWEHIASTRIGFVVGTNNSLVGPNGPRLCISYGYIT